MTSRDFCYWLQGYLELADSDKNKMGYSLSIEQMACLKKHLALVFTHEIDPSFGDKEKQDLLNKIHGHNGELLLRC